MNEESSINPSAVSEDSDTDVVSLLKRIQQQVLFLEKKIDLLIGQSQGKSSGAKSSPDRPFQKRSFAKPFRSFDHPQHRSQGEYGRTPGERDSARGHVYEHRPSQNSRSAGAGKKPFALKRKDEE